MTPEVKERIEQIRHGNVPEGYKKTAAGIMPITWRQVRIGDVCAVNPLRPKKQEERVTFLGMADVSEEGRLINPSIVDYTKVSKGFTPFERGDILVAKITPCFENGKGADTNALPTQQGYGSTEFHVLRCKDVDRRYMFLHTTSYEFRKKLESEMTGSAGQKRVQTESVASYLLGLPSIDEQQGIAEILTVQDKVIGLKEKLLAEKQRQKKYLMQHLLTAKKRLSGFDGEWKKVKLRKLLKERKTYSPKGTEYPHVTLSTEGIYAKSERYDRDHLVKNDDKEYKITHRGDICYNPANLKFGVICMNSFGDAIFSPIYVTFEVIGKVCPEFLAAYLMRWDFINAVRKYEEGTVYERMAVKPEDFLKFEMMLPPYEEQVAIAQILSIADKEIELLHQDLEQEKQKKKALMQLLLTGIVRVNA